MRIHKIFAGIIAMLGSIQLGLYILFLLVILSIPGAFIEQNLPPNHYLRSFGSVWGSIVLKGQLHRIFQSIYFNCLAILFILNISLCILQRIFSFIKEMKDPITSLHRKKGGIKLPIIFSNQQNSEICITIRALLKELGFSWKEFSKNESITFTARKGILRQYGLLIVHSTVLFLVFVVIYSHLHTEEKRILARPGQIISLPHTQKLVQINSFEFQRTLGADFSNYRTTLSVLSKNGNPEYQISTSVNHPPSIEGTRIYQISYDLAPDTVSGITIHLGQTESDTPFIIQEIKLHQRIKLQGTDFSIVADSFVCDFVFDVSRKNVFSRSKNHSNPAVHLGLLKNDSLLFSQWNLFKSPDFNNLKNTFIMKPVSYTPVYLTGLLIKYDPGVWFIFGALWAMSIGLLLLFMISFKQWMIVVITEKTQTNISCTLWGANKNLWQEEIQQFNKLNKKGS